MIRLCLGLLAASSCGASSNRTWHVTVSGQSAGGDMALQHLFAFSSKVDGVLSAAGSPYGCGALPHASKSCSYGNMYDSRLDAWVAKRQADGLIDDVKFLKSKPAIVFQGTKDNFVYTKVADHIVRQLRNYSMQVTPIENISAAHTWVLDHGSCDCGSCKWFWASEQCCDVNNCDFDLSGLMLRTFYGTIAPRAFAKNALAWIDQSVYVPPQDTWVRKGMLKWALAYVPNVCKEKLQSCKLHVNYHGCIDDGKSGWEERERWSSVLDLNEYAESNNIIVLYPQAHGTISAGKGCWNWGATAVKDDPLFDTKKSVQLRIVDAMISDIGTWVRTAQERPIGAGPPDQITHV